jgi:hypothetical protein
MIAFTASRAARLVAAFDATGLHRASTPGDRASGDWLADEASRIGAAVARAAVRLDRTIVDEAFVTCHGRRIDGLPMFDAPSTTGDGIRGTLVPCGGDGEIGFLELPPGAAAIKGREFEALRRAARHAAIVVATRVTGESLAPINAQYFDEPFGPPVLQVAGRHHAWLGEMAAAGRSATFVAQQHRERADSFNVEARVAGRPDAAPLAIVTPRTGWWESTAERAGGIVGWLAAIEAAQALGDRLQRSVHAFATCGHELGHVGLDAVLRAEAALLRDATRWLHLGANLGCGSSAKLVLRAVEAGDTDAMQALLVEEGYPAEAIEVQPIAQASGEGHDIVHHGGRVLSLIGTNAHFHAASDRWPGNVDAGMVAAIARAVARWVTLQAGRDA